ncbi:hypothetical protein, partial [Lancefieldella rimae]|uniref:hypothetical protein n=1 Tax=Lancefieldella rimae TaxID=1383 RepID=UPI003C7007D6
SQTCDVLLKSCDVLFYGEKTGFLAKSTSQPPVLEQKSTSQVAAPPVLEQKSTSQVAALLAALLATRFLQALLCNS